MRLLCIACLCLFGHLGLAAQTGCVEGFVLDSAGAGIANIHVIGAGSDRRSGFDVGTDSDGHFRIDTIPAGDYDIATSDECATDFRNINFTNAKPVSSMRAAAQTGGKCSSITLRRPVRARLRLKITDSLTAAAVPSAGASFRFDSQSSWNGFADERRELVVPPRLALDVRVGATGYEDSEPIKISLLNPGEVRELTAVLRPLQTGCITGVVLDQRDIPVSGVSVQAGPSDQDGSRLGQRVPTVATDKDGRFRFGPVNPGRYDIFTHAVPLGYPVDQEDGDLLSVNVPPGSSCADIAVRLGPKAARLQLTVEDAHTHRPVKDFRVAVFAGNPHFGWALNLRESNLPVPALKQFNVTVAADGYITWQVLTIAPLNPEETRQLTIELQPDGSIAKSRDQ